MVFSIGVGVSHKLSNMDDMEKPGNTAVTQVTENSEETAPEDTEVMSVASNSIKDQDEITSDLHLESIHSSMQSLTKEGSVHSMISIKSMDEKSITLVNEGLVHSMGMISITSIDEKSISLVKEGSMISITLKDEKSIQDDQDDQEEKKDPENQEDNAGQEDEEIKVKKQTASRHEYICVTLTTFICMTVPFIWYHLDRDGREDVILPGQTYNQAEDMKSNDSCPFWEILGDNYCDDEANILECGYDLDDCCKGDRDISLCTDCLCYIPEDKKILLEKQFEDKCYARYANAIEWETYLGDGNCDLGLNNKDHFFDIGDCCQENPMCLSKTFVSTAGEKCPEDICIESNIFCNEEELGDGICQGHNNGPLCEYDLGDCCLGYGIQTNCTCNCQCFMHNYFNIPWMIG